jgi:hypothetical protein
MIISRVCGCFVVEVVVAIVANARTVSLFSRESWTLEDRVGGGG